jgi:hypothetical protein
MSSLSRYKSLSTEGAPLIDFGAQPVSNRFLSDGGPKEAPSYPLALRVDSEDGLVHIAEPFPVDEIRPRYPWLTCFEPEAHLDELAERIIALPGIHSGSKISAYSFKDDTTLRRLEKLGFTNTWRIDPQSDLGIKDPLANVETFQQHFNPSQAEKIRSTRGASDVFIVRHVLEHSYDLTAFLEACKKIITPGGYIIFEVPDCARAFESGDYTTIWEEHIFYFTPSTLRNTLGSSGFEMVHFESVEYPFENSLVAVTSLGVPSASAESLQDELVRAKKFAESFNLRKNAIHEKLSHARSESGPIAMFGAGHLSVAFLSLMGIADLVDFVVDDNPNKRGMRMPLGNLPILGSQALYDRGVRTCLLSLNPQNQPKVIAAHSAFTASGGRFASIFPGGQYDLEVVL